MEHLIKKLIILGFITSLSFLNINAQEAKESVAQGEYETLKKEYDTLKKEYDALKSDSVSRKKRMDLFLNQHEDVVKKNEELKAEIERIKEQSAAAVIDSLTFELQEKNDSLMNVTDICNTQILKRDSIIMSLNDSINLLKAEMLPLQTFRKPFIVSLFKENEGHLEKPYSQIDVKELANMRNDLAEFSEDKEVWKRICRIDETIKFKAFFEDTINYPLTIAFDRNRVNSAMNKFKKLDKNKFSESQWKELTAKNKYLSRHRASTEAFQKIIKKIDDIINYIGGVSEDPSEQLQKDCVAQIESVFQPYEAREISLGINNIPYLKQRFEKYRKWVTSTPLTKNEEMDSLKQEILEIITTK